MFRWMQVFPFWCSIGPVCCAGGFVAAVGLFCAIAGLVTGNHPLAIAGSMAMLPGLFLWFLLWRTYKDDGYGTEHQAHNR